MPDLLLDPTSSFSVEARSHLNSCTACHQEFVSLQSTFALLDTWEAPEPSPYFDQKLAVRLREEQANPPENWFERMKSRLLFNTGRQFRPALVGSMALILLVGGGTFAGLSNLPSHEERTVSATVGDLQILDKNDQALQQMDQLFQDDDSPDDSSPPRS
ncbi:hypothetical protein [Granulicella arctica]|uniref:hypothetical protein n=1 Tax=Granulicella arctica TaxID=940613 RepID=UPI0021DFABE2|nr:hypothetical protein [Granulicella arctica]